MAVRSGAVTWNEWKLIPFTSISQVVSAKEADETAATLQECAQELKELGYPSQAFFDADPRIEINVDLDAHTKPVVAREGDRVVALGPLPQVFTSDEQYESSPFGEGGES